MILKLQSKISGMFFETQCSFFLTNIQSSSIWHRQHRVRAAQFRTINASLYVTILSVYFQLLFHNIKNAFKEVLAPRKSVKSYKKIEKI